VDPLNPPTSNVTLDYGTFRCQRVTLPIAPVERHPQFKRSAAWSKVTSPSLVGGLPPVREGEHDRLL